MHIIALNVLLLLCICVSFCAAFHPPLPLATVFTQQRQQLLCQDDPTMELSDNILEDTERRRRRGGARVAFLGNSILYYNDCPRFVVNLGKGGKENNGSSSRVEFQDSCLRGGTNLQQLWELGNGMKRHGFATDNAKIIYTNESDAQYDVGAPNVKTLLGGSKNDNNEEEEGGREPWDFIVFNDHTQGPARPKSCEATRQILLEKYLPLIAENGATPIIIETAAYRLPDIMNSQDLGSTHEFQRRVKEGVQSYTEALQSKLPSSIRPRMAPVGSAYLHVHENNRELWETLFDPYDGFHPSPSGTFLQGCVLHCSMFGSPPPLPQTEMEIASLWKDARMMHNVKMGGDVPLPSVDDAKYLWETANEICSQNE